MSVGLVTITVEHEDRSSLQCVNNEDGSQIAYVTCEQVLARKRLMSPCQRQCDTVLLQIRKTLLLGAGWASFPPSSPWRRCCDAVATLLLLLRPSLLCDAAADELLHNLVAPTIDGLHTDHRVGDFPTLPTASHRPPLLPTAPYCFPPLPTASHCFPLLPTASHCFLLLPTAPHCFPLLPTASHCFLRLPTLSYAFLLLPTTSYLHTSIDIGSGHGVLPHVPPPSMDLNAVIANLVLQVGTPVLCHCEI